MRVKIRFIQRLFIPPSLLAFIGLSLGPHGFGIIPLSTQTGTYAGILIAFIFGALPLISQKAAKGDADNIGSMWAYSQAGMLLQWAFGGLLGLLVLNRIWPLNLLRHHYAKRLLRRARYSSSHRTGFQPVRI